MSILRIDIPVLALVLLTLPQGGGAALVAFSPSQGQPDIVALVDRTLASAEHPGLTWSAIPDAVPVLEPFYAAEADRLLWFERDDAVPGVERALVAIGAAGDHGLNPADYDATTLGEQWTAIKAGAASPPERALFDLGLSVAAVRLIRAVHIGRVDPRTMRWGYDVAPKKIDVSSVVKEVREGNGLGATLDALQPPFAHYDRARKTLAVYKARARAGEPATVPALPKGQTKVEPGTTWDGVPPLTARLRALGDLGAGSADTADPGTAYAPRPGAGGEAIPGTARSRDRRRDWRGHPPGAERAPGPARQADRAGDGADALAAGAGRSSQPLRQRAAVPHVGHRPCAAATSRCA